MFHSRKIENLINEMHKRALKMIYNDTPNLSFDVLLIKNKPVSIHQRNLQLLATKIFKIKNGIAPELMNDIFLFVKRPYN